jgi:hypothetical protein
MKVSEIYAQYKILPFLQLHQLRVAAVAQEIVQHFTGMIDKRAVVLACLFHDMGNIIKVEFDTFPESFEPQGVPYWRHVQEDFLRRFGPDEHHATIAIAHELHLPLQVVQYIDGVGFSKLERSRDSHSYEQKIVEYADLRVAPQGVVSMNERLDEARKRYANRRTDMPADQNRYDALRAAAAEIEQQIFARTSIRPESITESSVKTIVRDLRGFRTG